MSEKRFMYNLHRGTILDNGKEIMLHEAMKLLNELDEKYVDEFALRETLQQELQRVEEENEQLKQDVDYFNRTYEVEERGLDIVPAMCTMSSPTPSRRELFNENEKLKSEIKDLNDVLARYEEKHQEEQINEYMNIVGKYALEEMNGDGKND